LSKASTSSCDMNSSWAMSVPWFLCAVAWCLRCLPFAFAFAFSKAAEGEGCCADY
jgi:hypothetical protein